MIMKGNKVLEMIERREKEIFALERNFGEKLSDRVTDMMPGDFRDSLIQLTHELSNFRMTEEMLVDIVEAKNARSTPTPCTPTVSTTIATPTMTRNTVRRTTVALVTRFGEQQLWK